MGHHFHPTPGFLPLGALGEELLADVLRLAVLDGTSQASPGGEDDGFVLFFAGDMFNSFSELVRQLPLAPDVVPGTASAAPRSSVFDASVGTIVVR